MWRGHDTDGAMFAFKILRESIADDEDSVARFIQERKILLSLEHSNLVRVEDMVVEGETLALVMELVAGGDLRSYLNARGTLTVEEACSLSASIADGLAAMHAAGIIHRDIKPENVLIDMSSGSPVPKITDFSIAKIVSTARQSTMMAGTPSYVAPELFDDAMPTVQSDLYSLGIVLYELLAGVPPFRSDSLLSMMKMHATQPPPRPPELSEEVWEIIDSLLAKHPAARPQDVLAAGNALRTLRPGLTAEKTFRKREQTVPSVATPDGTARRPSGARPESIPRPIGRSEPPTVPALHWPSNSRESRFQLSEVAIAGLAVGAVFFALLIEPMVWAVRFSLVDPQADLLADWLYSYGPFLFDGPTGRVGPTMVLASILSIGSVANLLRSRRPAAVFTALAASIWIFSRSPIEVGSHVVYSGGLYWDSIVGSILLLATLCAGVAWLKAGEVPSAARGVMVIGLCVSTGGALFYWGAFAG